MYKVNPDGSIEVSTPEEALELQRRIHGIPRLRSKVFPKGNGSEPEHEVLQKLRAYDGQVVNSETMKGIIGAGTTGGVGPKLYHMKNRIPGLGDVLHERKDARNHTSWKVKFSDQKAKGRGLYNDDDADADKANLIYTWKPRFDVEWEGGKLGHAVDRPPPAKSVFAVIASPNVRHREKYGEVDCFIAAWNWIEEDSVLAEAPIEWVDRYDRKLWSRADT